MAKQKITPIQIYNPVKFYAYSGSAQNSVNGTSFVALNTEYFDTGNNFNTGSYAFTAPVAGFYQFNFSVSASGSSPSQWQGVLWKNSSSYVMWGNNNATTTFAQSVGGGLLQLAANDTIALYLSANGVSAIQVNPATTYLTGYLVSTT